MSRAHRILLTVVAAAGSLTALAAETPEPAAAERLRAELLGFFERQAELSPTVLAGVAANPELERAIADGLAHMSSDELAGLSAGFAGVPAWELAPEALSAALPPAVRQALERRGEQAEHAARELEAFRDELSTFLAAARLLPGATRSRIGIDDAALDRATTSLADLELGTLDQARSAADGLGNWRALRRSLIEALPPGAQRHLPALADRLPLDEPERASLAEFRGGMTAALATFEHLPAPLAARLGGERAGRVRAALERASAEQLFLLREEIDAVALGRAVETLAVLVGEPPSEQTAAELEAFRAEMLGFYRELGQAEALQAVEALSPRRLALLRAAVSGRPSGSPIPLELPIAIGRLPDEAIDRALVNLNCVATLGSINVFGATIALPNLDLNWICTPLENAINAVDAAVSSLSDTVDGVLAAVTDLPDLLLSGIEGFFNGLLADVNAFFSPANLQSLLGLGGDFWNRLPQLPQIPCPEQGTEIPFFGPVGDELTAAKYGRYLWVFDKVLEMIPDTEVSLSVKIPAQVLYGGVQYLGVCLDAAAAESVAAATQAFRGVVEAGLEAAKSEIAGVGRGVDGIGSSLEARIGDLRALELDLAIESALAGSGATRVGRAAITDGRIATFQLPAAFGGALEWVRDSVAAVISRMQAAGEDVHCAPQSLADGDGAFTIGEYKLAYDGYRRAYQEAARTGSPGCTVAPAAATEP